MVCFKKQKIVYMFCLVFQLDSKFLFLSNLLVKYFLFPVRTIFAVIESENLTIVKMFGFLSWSNRYCTESISNVSPRYN